MLKIQHTAHTADWYYFEGWKMEGHQALKLQQLIMYAIEQATALRLDVSLPSLKMTEMHDSSFLAKTNSNTKSALLDG